MYNRARLVLALALGFLMVLAVAGFLSRPQANEALAGAVQDQPATVGGVLADAGLTASRACVFGPYSTDEMIADKLGFRWERASDFTDIGSSDSHELVVAAEEDQVVAWAMVPRPAGLELIGDYGCQPAR